MTCSHEGCERATRARGMCLPHYDQARHAGTFVPAPCSIPAEERFRARITKESNGCWLWTGLRDRQGYGLLGVGRRHVRAHRWAYEHFIGPIPAGLILDHVVCDTPSCCNPRHVRPTTHVANVMRGQSPHAQNARASHCRRDHEFTPDNTYVTPDGRRQCRTCRRAANLRWSRATA